MAEKVTTIVCWCLFRVLLPLALLAAAVFRFNALSFIYLVCLLVTPLLKYPMVKSIAGCTGWFLKALITLSLLPILTHICLHIAFVVKSTEMKTLLQNCSDNEMIARQIGFQRLQGVPAYEVVRLVLPDIVVFIVAVVVLVVSNTMIRRDTHEEADLPIASSLVRRKLKVASTLNYLGEFFVGLLLAASSIMIPSVLSAVYFLVFLMLAILWACYQKLGNRFAYFRIVLMIYTGAHILTLHLYQFQFFQEALPRESFVARLLGLTGIIETDCERTYALSLYHDIRWMYFVNPAVLLLLYWVLAFETNFWYKTKGLKAEEIMAGSLYQGQVVRKKRRRMASAERQVPPNVDLDEWGFEIPCRCIDSETGSLVFSGSTYGDDGTDKEHLVEEEGNVNYNSLDQGPFDSEAQAEPTERLSQNAEEVVSDKRKVSKRTPVVSVFMLAMKQSYVLMLISMMAWSIMYLSWLTFVLLLTACLLWMMPNSRRVSLVTSPVLVLYVVCLLIAQYIFNMSLEIELPTMAGVVQIKEIGLNHYETPAKDLAFQIFFAMFFLMTLRQFMRERRPASDTPSGYQMQSRPTEASQRGFSDFMNLGLSDYRNGYDSATVRILGHILMEMMCKYWIFVCAGMLLLMAVQEVVIYRIIYMILFLIFIICFQVSYGIWRVLMFAFWWLVIIYSMVVLTIIYTYQFEHFPAYWQNNTGWNNNTLADIGLEKFGGTELFIKLLTPTSFLIVIILQVHYFHKPFLRMSALDRYEREDEVMSEPGLVRWLESVGCVTSETDTECEEDPQTSIATHSTPFKRRLAQTGILIKIMLGWKTLTSFLWRLAEIHIFKLVIIIVMFVAVQESEVSALSAVYVIFVILLLPFVRTKAHLVLSHLIVIWTSLIILVKVLFQLRLVEIPSISVCDSLNSSKQNKSFSERSTDNIKWLGLQKIDSATGDIGHYIRLYILILGVVLFESIVRYHQRQHFNHPGITQPPEGIIFGTIWRTDADKGIIPCIKFFVNYVFYKFGLEICYVTTAVTVCIRMDVFAVFYIILLAFMMLLSRQTSARTWWLYMLILAILLPVQYFEVLGFPAIACIIYPWTNLHHFSALLERWLYLPDVQVSPPSIVLLADVVQLLFVTLQWRVFRIEQANQEADCGGGDNKEILEEVEAINNIPVGDFTVSTSMYLDVCKQAVFEYMFWVTLAIVFIAGATRVNIFGLGYVIAVFCFMWYGKEFLLKPLRKLLRMWNFLIAYVVFVLFTKACLQLVGCVYVSKLFERQCWVIQLFGINCLLPTRDDIITEALSHNCIIVEDNTGLTWDVVCFAFLLLQRRIYGSHYFRHVVNLLEAQSRLSSRGAELINHILVRAVEKQNRQEREILVTIKEKMKTLKERQAALRKDFKEPTEHFQAIRAGDYYLFDEEEQEESSEALETPVDTLTFGNEAYSSDEKRLGPLQVINTAVDQGADAAVDQVRAQDELDRAKTATEMKTATVADDIPAEDVIEKAKTWGSFFATLLGSIADWLIVLCNRISHNYRLVARKLEGELRIEKEKIELRDKPRSLSPIEMTQIEHSQDLVSTSNPTFTCDEEEISSHKKQKSSRAVVVKPAVLLDDRSDDTAEPAGASPEFIEVTMTPGDLAFDDDSASVPSLDELEARQEYQEREFERSQPQIYRLAVAIVYMLISHSELLCYFLMILDHMVYASLLSMPLPFMIFMWGMLSVPRPSKTFWITVITYAEAVVVTKYLFQFGFFPWNDGHVQNSPFFPPRILGIEQKNNYANVDIALLLALFIHRSILKRYGLWKDTKDINADMAKAGRKEIEHPQHSSQPIEDGTNVDGSDEIIQEPGKIKKSLQTAVAPFVIFFKEMTHSRYNATVDVYAPMFCCDFINFFIVVFGYQSFGPAQLSGDGDVRSYITENRVPVPFLVMLILQFVLIVVDRALFLRKNVLGKCIFQLLLLVLIHIWMFFVLPDLTGSSFYENVPAQLWYFVKCIYFALSAYQIRCGYPTRILGNFLTKKYNYLNLFLFKGFLAVPFLLELRALMDWIWTDSTLAIGSWLQMEDIYANIFVLKCWRHAEKAYPTPRAQKKVASVKYGVGGLLLFIIILIIWFPLVIFAFANTVFDPNPPSEVTIQLQLGTYQPIFKMSIQQNIRPMSGNEKNQLMEYFGRDQVAVSFLNRFETSDISVISFNGQSTSIWGISEPAQIELIQVLNESITNDQKRLSLKFAINVIRSSDSKASDTLTTYFAIKPNVTEITKLMDVINGSSNESVQVNQVYPSFIQITSRGIEEAGPLINKGKNGFGATNIKLGLEGSKGIGSLNQYWSIQQYIPKGSPFRDDDANVGKFTRNIRLVTFSDRKAPSTLSFVSGYGIIGLYVSFILLIGRFLRLSTTGQYLTIVFNELPSVDNILQLCLDIYLVREMKEFHLEEDLYAKLIFLYRSPETMIKWSRPKTD